MPQIGWWQSTVSADVFEIRSHYVDMNEDVILATSCVSRILLLKACQVVLTCFGFHIASLVYAVKRAHRQLQHPSLHNHHYTSVGEGELLDVEFGIS